MHSLVLLLVLMLACTFVAAQQVRKLPSSLPVGPPCPALSKELLQSKAKDNFVLLTIVDKLVMQRFGQSFVRNIMSANISYWFIAALDPWTSLTLGSMGRDVRAHCFNAPQDRLKYKGEGSGYQWGSHHWHQTTWNKVHIVAAVYEMGFHIVHSDTDVTWFQDPMPFFSKYKDGPVHALFATDSLDTRNKMDDQGVEASTTSYININTGIYFIRQYAQGNSFFQEWLKFQDRKVGHDQDGLNALVRGEAHRGDKSLNPAIQPVDKLIGCAQHNATLVSLLPVSMFGNAYTYVNGRVHEQLHHPLYEVHWVWAGSTMESKQQTMRDALKFWDPPQYYGVGEPALQLLTMEPLWVPTMPVGFNAMKFEETEEMIQFHLLAANAQLQQVYYGFMAAMALNRTFIMPRFACFCAKNWYMTQMCRINGEMHTQFPYTCALSHLMRAKRLLAGFKVKDTHASNVMHIKEYSFLENINVPAEIKTSLLVVTPADKSRPEGEKQLDLSQVKTSTRADGTALLIVPWPLNDAELTSVLGSVKAKYRVVHISNATKIMGKGFQDSIFQKNFDKEIQTLVTYWCCRSPKDMTQRNLTDKVQLRILPPHRQQLQLSARMI